MKRTIVALTALAFAAGAAVAQTPKKGGNLTFAISAETPHYDCHGSETYATLHFAAPFYSTLVRFNLSKFPEIESDLAKSWEVAPDFASVNFHEEGAVALAEALLAAGVAVEAGLWTPSAAETLAASGLAPACVRFLIEPMDDDVASALATADKTLAALDGVAPEVPRLLHGQGSTVWPLVDEAWARGLQSRVGLEDTVSLPDGPPLHSVYAVERR